MTMQETSINAIADIPFGEANGFTLLLNIAHPEPLPDHPMPAVIYLHGGGWQEGDRHTTRNDLLAAHGFFTISVEYRLSHQAIFPAQLHDVKAAVRWLRANAATYNIDPERIGVWGYSAGAHLAALLGTTGDVAELEGNSGSPGQSSRVQAVVTIAAPTDFSQMGGWHNAPDVPEARLIGGPVQEKVAEVQRANPITYVQPGMPPFLLIHGEQDNVVPVNQSQLLYEALQAVEADVTFRRFPGVDHNFNVDAPAWPEAQQLALAFFTKHLR